jgi:secreted trypsin-like serine protease
LNFQYNIITAAHCCDGQNAGDVTVVAGEHRVFDNADDGTEQLLRVQEIILNPSYSRFTLQNDICLIKLAEPIEMNT